MADAAETWQLVVQYAGSEPQTVAMSSGVAGIREEFYAQLELAVISEETATVRVAEQRSGVVMVEATAWPGGVG